jgi:hypothetical protein
MTIHSLTGPVEVKMLVHLNNYPVFKWLWPFWSPA